jgi:hypothetical protein
MPKADNSEKGSPAYVRVASKFSFLNTVAIVLLIVAALVSIFK